MNTEKDAPLVRFLSLHGLASYDQLVDRAAREPEWFWEAVMQFFGLHFFKPYERLLDVSNGPEWPQWCVGGTTNIAYNCLDRTIANGFGDKTAILWEGEDGARSAMTYTELRETVRKAAGGLSALGIGQGDVVGLFMPSVPETIAAFLAIASIGAIALPMFSGFGAHAVADRLMDAGAVAVITVDRTYRRGKAVEMAEIVDSVRGEVQSIRHIVVVPRDPQKPDPRWLCWNEMLSRGTSTAPVELPAEAPMMLVYTSGTSGKSKGTVHTHCGFMTKVALDFGMILDLRTTDRLLWMSDMGWLTGPILAVASPLVGATTLLAEGVPDYPEQGRLWRLAQDYAISFLGVAPTMVRSFMQHPAGTVESYDLSAVRVTASTGEPWTPEAWNWFDEKVCGKRAPILNYSGGTEIGGGILAGTILHRDLKPCAFAGPIPGMGAVVVDAEGYPVPRGEVGELALTVPSIGLTRGLWHDRERYLESYWSQIPGMWVHGDFASVDEDGNWFIHGRSDDTIKIAGKRTGPAEIETYLYETGKVAEAAAIGIPDPVKGSAVVCVCVLASGVKGTPEVSEELRRAVADGLGSSFRPKEIIFVDDIPKTRSMKTMRRVVRSVCVGKEVGDLSGLVNPEAVTQLRDRLGAGKTSG
ncbi:MAG: AMP-binding protein [Betaproteobacteria bacterium]|nr:AMP-binding protein [Betaproteobacteria bacterium]